MRWRLWMLGLLAVLVVVLAVDWLAATLRLANINVEVLLDPPSVVADGKSSTHVSVRITENGQPRAHDLLQAWLGTGAGRVMPDWVYTDEEGTAVIKYTPNRYSVYDPQDYVRLNILDTSIGRLVEVGKHTVVYMPIEKPDGEGTAQ